MIKSLPDIGLKVNQMMDEEFRYLGEDEQENRYEFKPRLYSYSSDGLIFLEDKANDPYELFDNVFWTADLEAVVLVCTGWAAPFGEGEENTRPSLHAERRRVAINVAYDGTKFCSRLRYEDDEAEDTLLDDNVAGALAEAMADWWHK
jgi:hypothetical protein